MKRIGRGSRSQSQGSVYRIDWQKEDIVSSNLLENIASAYETTNPTEGAKIQQQNQLNAQGGLSLNNIHLPLSHQSASSNTEYPVEPPLSSTREDDIGNPPLQDHGSFDDFEPFGVPSFSRPGYLQPSLPTPQQPRLNENTHPSSHLSMHTGGHDIQNPPQPTHDFFGNTAFSSDSFVNFSNDKAWNAHTSSEPQWVQTLPQDNLETIERASTMRSVIPAADHPLGPHQRPSLKQSPVSPKILNPSVNTQPSPRKDQCSHTACIQTQSCTNTCDRKNHNVGLTTSLHDNSPPSHDQPSLSRSPQFQLQSRSSSHKTHLSNSTCAGFVGSPVISSVAPKRKRNESFCSHCGHSATARPQPPHSADTNPPCSLLTSLGEPLSLHHDSYSQNLELLSEYHSAIRDVLRNFKNNNQAEKHRLDASESNSQNSTRVNTSSDSPASSRSSRKSRSSMNESLLKELRKTKGVEKAVVVYIRGGSSEESDSDCDDLSDA